MSKLLYIGKSNKTYKYSRMYYQVTNDFYVTVYYNSNQMMTFKDKDYFDKNFKLLSEHEYNQLIRKLKLKRINKREGQL